MSLKRQSRTIHRGTETVAGTLLLLALLMALFGVSPGQAAIGKEPVIGRFLAKLPADQFVAGADGYGSILDSVPVAPIMRNGETVGYAYVTSDFVGTTGYSGKPIHVMVAIAPDGKIIAAELVKHSEPIVLIGIPDKKIKALTVRYAGLDLVAEAAAGQFCSSQLKLPPKRSVSQR